MLSGHGVFTGSLEFVAFLPANHFGESSSFPSERKPEAGHRRIPREIHLRVIFVARLVIVFFVEFLVLRRAPGLVVSFELDSFVDGERGNANACQAEVIRTIVVSSVGARIRANVQAKLFGGSFSPGIKCGTLRARY